MINLQSLLNNLQNTSEGGQTRTNTYTQERLATTKQIEAYIKACESKNVTIDPNHKNWTVKEMSEKLNELYKLQAVKFATKNQVDTIIKLSNQLGLPEPKAEVIQQFDRKKASDMIGKLLAKVRAIENTRPTEQQLAIIAEMMSCPDVIITELIPVHPTLLKELEEFTILYKKMTYEGLKKAEYKGEPITLEEVIQAIIKTKGDIEKQILSFDLTKLNRQDVFNFIGKYKQAFYDWKDSRCTERQRERIRQLQERLAELSSWATDMDTIPVDIDGSPLEINSCVKDEFIFTGQHILTDEELIQFSKDQASQFIQQLEKELRDKELRYVTNNEAEIPDDVARSVLDISQIAQKEQEKLTELMYTLYAMIGQEAETEIINATNIGEHLKDLIDLCTLFFTKEEILETIEKYFDSSQLLDLLGFDME